MVGKPWMFGGSFLSGPSVHRDHKATIHEYVQTHLSINILMLKAMRIGHLESKVVPLRCMENAQARQRKNQ